MSNFTVYVALPPAVLHPNARFSWRKKIGPRKKYRQSCGLRAYGASGGLRPRWKRATCHLCYYRASKRPMDRDNLLAWAKSAIDALQDAGIIENDKGLTFLPVEERLGVDPTAEELRIEIIARQFGVTDANVYSIQEGLTWQHV